MTTERIVSTAEQSEWRKWWGLPTKAIHVCPVCGVEVYRSRSCKYHSDSRNNRARAVRERQMFRQSLIRALCDGIEEACRGET